MIKKLQQSFFKIKLLFLLLVLVGGMVISSFTSVDSPGEVNVKVLRFYPNPATSYIVFELSDDVVNKGHTLQTYSFLGKSMKEVPINSNKITIPITSDYYRGIYLFQLKDKNKKIVEAGRFNVVK